MLRDTVRNQAFHRALEKTVRPETAVLDIGAGTGVWAIAAARLGARRVVAIEADAFLVGLIRRLAIEAGVGDRVEAVHGWSTQVPLDREFDLVISETIGYDGFEEQIVLFMMDARNRFLRPGGKIIPETIGLFAAPASFRPTEAALPRGVPFTLPHFDELNRHAPFRPQHPRDLILKSRPARLIEIDLHQPPQPSVLEDLRAQWTVEDAAAINCVAVWVESRLTSGVRLSTRRTTSWTPVVYPILPTPGSQATLEFELCLAGRREWRVTVTTPDATTSQVRSPRLAAESFATARTAGEQ